MKVTLSVVLATRNEQKNIGPCLKSVNRYLLTPLRQDYAGHGEIIIFDENSVDKTREIALEYGAKVTKVKHEDNFHITKQKAIEAATGDWILQLDADEVISSKLAKEIVTVISSDNKELLKRTTGHPEFISGSGLNKIPKQVRNDKAKLFKRHQQLIEQREGKLGNSTSEVVAFFLPRVNYFLGGPLVHAGVYPDGVIRLFKAGKARLPAKSVHELMEVDGEVAWLFNDLEHHESPTLKRYISRMNRYTYLHAQELHEKKVGKNVFKFYLYTIYKPLLTFIKLFIRHKGFMDGMRGFLWSALSAMHYPIAYFKYWTIWNG